MRHIRVRRIRSHAPNERRNFQLTAYVLSQRGVRNFVWNPVDETSEHPFTVERAFHHSHQQTQCAHREQKQGEVDKIRCAPVHGVRFCIGSDVLLKRRRPK